MAYKVYTHSHPRHAKGEVSTKPSLTDELCNEPIDKVVDRFLSLGSIPNGLVGDTDLEVDDKTTLADIDRVLSDSGSDNLAEFDRVDLADFVATAQRLAQELREKSVNKAPKTPGKESEKRVISDTTKIDKNEN